MATAEVTKKKRGRKKGGESIDILHFVEILEDSQSEEEVANHFKISVEKVRVKIHQLLNDYNVPVKTFKVSGEDTKKKILDIIARKRGISLEQLLAQAEPDA